MAKLWVSSLIGLMKLAIVLSLAAFTFNTSEQAAYLATHSSATFVATAIDVVPSHNGVSAADKESDHHSGGHGSRKCCGAMCTVFAVLIDMATLADRTPTTTYPLAVWSEPDSFFSPRLYRPPIA